MCSRHLLVIAAAAVAYGNPDANRFMDEVLNDMNQQAVQYGLDPVPSKTFFVFVARTVQIKQDFIGNFVQGSGYGLSKMYRIGNCTYGSYGDGLKLGCNVALGTVKYVMSGEAKGDTVTPEPHAITTSSQISPRDYILLEFSGFKGQPAILDNIIVPPINVITRVVQGSVDLIPARYQLFDMQMNGYISRNLRNTLENDYPVLLRRVLQRHMMP